MKLGGKFWMWVILGAIGCFIAGMALFLLIERAWYRWGFFGAFLFISLLLIIFAWFYDRRHPHYSDPLEVVPDRHERDRRGTGARDNIG